MCNLVLVGRLDDEKHNMIIIGGAWKVKKRAMVVTQGCKTRIPYMTSSCRDTVANVDVGVNSNLWH